MFLINLLQSFGFHMTPSVLITYVYLYGMFSAVSFTIKVLGGNPQKLYLLNL